MFMVEFPNDVLSRLLFAKFPIAHLREASTPATHVRYVIARLNPCLAVALANLYKFNIQGSDKLMETLQILYTFLYNITMGNLCLQYRCSPSWSGLIQVLHSL
jgi:hypothetical protein